MLNKNIGGTIENSVIITVRSDIGAGVSGFNQGITALLDLSTKSGIADKVEKRDCVVSFSEGFTSVYAKHIEKILHICEAVCVEGLSLIGKGAQCVKIPSKSLGLISTQRINLS